MGYRLTALARAQTPVGRCLGNGVLTGLLGLPECKKSMGSRLATLKRRSEFQRVRGGGRFAGACFVLESKPRPSAPKPADEKSLGARFGFTVTRQIGNAVVRNRIRRRLKAAVVKVAPHHAALDRDYVIIARLPALEADFDLLCRDLQAGFSRVHAAPMSRSGGGGRRTTGTKSQ